MLERDFNLFVSHLVSYHLSNSSSHTSAQVSECIGVSQSFFDKCLYGLEGKHFNMRHLFLISQALSLDISALIPSIANYKLLHNKQLSANEWKELIQLYKHTARG